MNSLGSWSFAWILGQVVVVVVSVVSIFILKSGKM